MSDNAKARKEWIDVLRALAIIFVIYGHQLKKGDHAFIYYVFTSPIKIPLFLAISGYLFRENDKFIIFFRKVIRGLVVPWLVLSLTPVFLSAIIKGGAELKSGVISVLSGTSFWYMPCCIIAEFVFYALLKCCRRICDKYSILISAAVGLTFIGILLIKYSILDVLMINRALSVQLFLLLGYSIHRYEEVLDRIRLKHLWTGVIIYVCFGLISIFVYPEENLDVHRGVYYNLPICSLMIFVGCTVLFSFARKFEFHSKVLGFIGRNTLIYYIWANYSVSVYRAIASKLHVTIHNVSLSACIETLFVCCLCAVVAAICNRFFPEVVGKKRVCKHKFQDTTSQ